MERSPAPTAGDVHVDVSPDRRRGSNLSIAVVGLAALMAVLPQTLVLPVVPVIARDLGAAPGDAQWLLTSTLLAGAVAVPIVSRFADMWGRRLVLQITLVTLVIGSLIDALTSDLAVMIVGRALSGISAAAVPLGISLLASTLPAGRRAHGMVFVSAMLGVGTALGLPLAGFVASRADYRLLYWIIVVGAVVSLILISVVVREPRRLRTRTRVDVPGVLLLIGGLGGLVLSLAQGPAWGWSSARVVGLLIGSLALIALLVMIERRTQSPLINIQAITRPPVLITNAAAVFVGFALFATFVGTSTYVQAPKASGYGFDASVLTAGLTLLPSGLLMLILAPVASWLIKSWGGAWVLCVAGAIITVGLFARILVTSELWEVVAGTSIVGIGSGLAYGALPSLITSNAHPDELAAANGINSLARSLGSALASAAGGSVLVAQTAMIHGTAVPTLAAYRTLFAVCAVAALLAAAGGALVARMDGHGVPASS